MSKSDKLAAILEKVAAILDFQMFTYLDLKMPQNHLYCSNNHASVSIINYVDKWICKNGIFVLGDLYDLENDLETQNWQWHPPTSFFSSYEWLIPRGCQLLTNNAVKNIVWGFGWLTIGLAQNYPISRGSQFNYLSIKLYKSKLLRVLRYTATQRT